MAIGYGQARALMRQLDWQMRVTVICRSVEEIVLFHPLRPNEYKVRIDSDRKLTQECEGVESLREGTTVLKYDRSEKGERNDGTR